MFEQITLMATNIAVLFVAQFIILAQHFSLFGLLVFILFLLQRSIFALSVNVFDGRAIYISAWIGTPIHELSHAFFCLLFGHRIQKVALFNPDNCGTLGYVTHSYNNHNLWQVMGNFFIGIAPLFGGLFALYLLTYFLLDDAASLFQLLKFVTSTDTTETLTSQLLILATRCIDIIQQAYFLSPVKVLVWAYCCAAVSLHLSPSKEDLKGAWVGFFVFLFICLSLMIINQWLGWEWFSDLQILINLISLLYLIGIVLGCVLLMFLLTLKGVLKVFNIT